MSRLKTIAAAAVISLGLASGAAAQSTVVSSGGAEIEASIVVQTSGEVIFQDIEITPDTSIPTTTIVTSTASTNVTVVGAGGDAVSFAVPQTIDAVSEETGQSVTVVTNTQGEYAAIKDFQTLLSSGGLLSVDVGGAIQISANQLLPGEYRGLLVVVAQYN